MKTRFAYAAALCVAAANAQKYYEDDVTRSDSAKDAIDDVADDVADALEDWAEDQRDQNSDLLDSIAESTNELIVNVGRNVTDSLSKAVNQRFERIMNETAQALN